MNWLLVALLLVPGLACAEDVAAPRPHNQAETQAAAKRVQYQALLRAAMARAAEAKMQADADRARRQKAEQP